MTSIENMVWETFGSDFSTEIAAALSEQTGREWRKELQPAEATDAKMLNVRITFEGAVRGSCEIEVTGQDALDGAGDDEQEARILQVLSKAATRLSSVQSKYGVFQATCTPRKGVIEAVKTLVFELANLEEPRVRFTVRADNALIQSLLLRRAANENPQYAAVQSLFEMLPDPANLEVVMDVELDVTLRFGQRHLTLREVLDLTSGSVVELDRQVDEPVELVLDGRVIARGEAVVVDGNYGLRVTEVPHALGRQLPA